METKNIAPNPQITDNTKPKQQSLISSSPNKNEMKNNGYAVSATTMTTTTRSETNTYPTTFVQADTFSFKQVVQMLTGSTETAKQASSPKPISSNHQQDQSQSSSSSTSNNKSFVIPPIKTVTPKKQSSNNYKLYERRLSNSNLKNSLMINTLIPRHHHQNQNHHQNKPTGFSPRNQEILSPSMLDFPKLALSPVTPLNQEVVFGNKSSSMGNCSSGLRATTAEGTAEVEGEEERAMVEKGYYLHPSPMSTPRDSEPQLLPLFPVTSPRV